MRSSGSDHFTRSDVSYLIMMPDLWPRRLPMDRVRSAHKAAHELRLLSFIFPQKAFLLAALSTTGYVTPARNSSSGTFQDDSTVRHLEFESSPNWVQKMWWCSSCRLIHGCKKCKYLQILAGNFFRLANMMHETRDFPHHFWQGHSNILRHPHSKMIFIRCLINVIF